MLVDHLVGRRDPPLMVLEYAARIHQGHVQTSRQQGLLAPSNSQTIGAAAVATELDARRAIRQGSELAEGI